MRTYRCKKCGEIIDTEKEPLECSRCGGKLKRLWCTSINMNGNGYKNNFGGSK